MDRHHKTNKVAIVHPLVSKRLLDQVCERIGDLDYSFETEKTCSTPRASSVAIGTVLV
jgi:hypothetical protein